MDKLFEYLLVYPIKKFYEIVLVEILSWKLAGVGTGPLMIVTSIVIGAWLYKKGNG